MFYPSIIIQAGSSAVMTKQNKILKANLGSCVGVIITDEVNKVGGLLHCLLPEPYSNFADIPEKYASSGLPKFIDELIKSGADISNLKASVAGGGFLESPDSLDLSINIGGKTAEKVKEILSLYKIPVTNWETGGFFSCSISLNMDDFRVNTTPYIEDKPITGDNNGSSIITREEIIKRIEKIKPVPQVILKIIRMLNTISASLKDIAGEIKKDQVISAKSIKLCNSAAFDRPYPIHTIDDAIIQLGEENIIKHILEYYLQEIFEMADRGYSLCQGGLFHHAVSTALINEKLSEYTGLSNKKTAYSAGLLHDIGKILLDQNMARIRPFFYRDISKNKTDILTAENNNIGINHCEAGILIADKWKFPKVLKDVIRYHHNPDEADDNKDLIVLTHISDIISSWFVTGVLPETSRLEKSAETLNSIGLSPEKIYRFIDLIPIRELANLFPVKITDVNGKKEHEEIS